MKSKFLTLVLTSLFLFGCSSKIKETTYEDLQTKINNSEDFILLLTSKSCGHCKNLKQSIKKSNYNFDIIDMSMDDVINGVKNNDEEYIKAYKYLFNKVFKCFTHYCVKFRIIIINILIIICKLIFKFRICF